MSNWEEKLDKLEEILRDEIESGQTSGHLFPFCRLVIALGGDEVLKYLTDRLERYLQNEGFYTQPGCLEQTILGLLADFLYCALKRSGAPTLVIRYAEKKEEQLK